MDLWRGTQAIKQRKELFLAVFLITLLTVVLVPRGKIEITYESSAKILLTPPAGMEDSVGRRQVKLWFADETTLRELVTSEKLLKRVITKLDLKTAWVDLRDQITFKTPGRRSSRSQSVTLFYLIAADEQPERAQKIASELVKEFVRYIQELSAQEFADTRRYLEELVAEAKEKVETLEEQLLTITANKAVGDGMGLLESETNLERERLRLKAERAQLESETDAINGFLTGQSKSPPWTIVSQRDQMVGQLETAISEAELKLLELKELYKEDSRLVKEQQAKVDKVRGLYDSQVNQVVTSLYNEKLTALKERRDQLSQVSHQLLELRKQRLTPEEKRQVTKLERELNMWEESHLSLVRQLYQARVVEQSSRRQGAIQVLEQPSPGRATEGKVPNLATSILMGIPFSLLVALGVVLGAEYWNSSLQFIPRVEQRLELPVLVSIPLVPEDLANEWESVKVQLD